MTLDYEITKMCRWIQIGFTFLVPAHPGRPGQRAIKRVCVDGCMAQIPLDNLTQTPRELELLFVVVICL